MYNKPKMSLYNIAIGWYKALTELVYLDVINPYSNTELK